MTRWPQASFSSCRGREASKLAVPGSGSSHCLMLRVQCGGQTLGEADWASSRRFGGTEDVPPLTSSAMVRTATCRGPHLLLEPARDEHRVVECDQRKAAGLQLGRAHLIRDQHNLRWMAEEVCRFMTSDSGGCTVADIQHIMCRPGTLPAWCRSKRHTHDERRAATLGVHALFRHKCSLPRPFA